MVGRPVKVGRGRLVGLVAGVQGGDGQAVREGVRLGDEDVRFGLNEGRVADGFPGGLVVVLDPVHAFRMPCVLCFVKSLWGVFRVFWGWGCLPMVGVRDGFLVEGVPVVIAAGGFPRVQGTFVNDGMGDGAGGGAGGAAAGRGHGDADRSRVEVQVQGLQAV